MVDEDDPERDPDDGKPTTPRERPAGDLQDAIEGPVGGPVDGRDVVRGGAGFAAEQQDGESGSADAANPRRSTGRPPDDRPAESDTQRRGKRVAGASASAGDTDAEPDPDETTIGVPVGESGISIDALESGGDRQPTEPPFETRTHEIEYNQQAGYIGAKDGPDAPARTLSTTTTILEFEPNESARVTVDRQDTIITAMFGHGYELLVRVVPRYADRPAETGGTRAIVEVVEREAGTEAAADGDE